MIVYAFSTHKKPSSKEASPASSPMLVPAMYPPDHAFYEKNNRWCINDLMMTNLEEANQRIYLHKSLREFISANNSSKIFVRTKK